MKKVSVIVPTYKRSEFLPRAIDSLLAQTHPEVEVVVVDDNISDSKYRLETERQMAKYNEVPHVRYIKNKTNLGGALARNEGINQATGEYITFLDDDDIYLPEKISKQLQFMVKNQLDMSFTDVRIHNSSDKLVDYREHPYVKSSVNEELLKQHIMHHLTPTATYMFKKEAIVSIGAFDDAQVGQEFWLMLKAIETGLKIDYLPVAHIIQYLHSGERISVGQNKIKKEKEMYNFKKKYYKHLSFRQKQYVKFRHHAVLMFVGKRSGNFSVSIEHLIKALITSPLDCMMEFIYHIKKIRQNKAAL